MPPATATRPSAETLTFSPAPGLPDVRHVATTSWPPATSRSTRPTAPASTATAWAPASRSTPSWSCPTPTSPSTQGAHRAVGRRAQPVLRAGCSSRCARPTSIAIDVPWSKLPKAKQKLLLYGVAGRVKVQYRTATAAPAATRPRYEGVIPYLQRRHSEAESDSAREQIEGYMREVPCPACGGARLKPLHAGGHHRRPQHRRDLRRCRSARRPRCSPASTLTERDRMIAERVVKEINARMGFLLDVGLDYLTLARSAATLAGGEAQRIRLASQIGSGLVGVLYVLDEPSIGLHQRDNRRLIETLDAAARPRQHRARRRARRGDHQGGRPRRRHRPGRRRARRRRRLRRPGQGPAQVARRRSPASTCRAGESIPVPELRRKPAAESLVVRGRPRAQPARTSTSSSRSAASWRSPACRGRASRRSSTTSCCGR